MATWCTFLQRTVPVQAVREAWAMRCLRQLLRSILPAPLLPLLGVMAQCHRL